MSGRAESSGEHEISNMSAFRGRAWTIYETSRSQLARMHSCLTRLVGQK